MKSNCIAVPAESLAVNDWNTVEPRGDKGEGKPKKILPMAGDPVDFQVRGSVERVEGGTAYVRLAFINGQRAVFEDDGDDAAMRKLAKEADEKAED